MSICVRQYQVAENSWNGTVQVGDNNNSRLVTPCTAMLDSVCHVLFSAASSTYLTHAAHHMIQIACAAIFWAILLQSIQFAPQRLRRQTSSSWLTSPVTPHLPSPPSFSPTPSLAPRCTPQIDHGHIMELDSAAVVSRVLMKSTETAPVRQSVVATFENSWTFCLLRLRHHPTQSIRESDTCKDVRLYICWWRCRHNSPVHLPPHHHQTRNFLYVTCHWTFRICLSSISHLAAARRSGHRRSLYHTGARHGERSGENTYNQRVHGPCSDVL